MRKTTLLAFLLALAVTTTPGCSMGPRRAVFLIVVDTLRPDRLSCYGYAFHKTPNIDRLSGLGVRFGNAQSTASWTIAGMGAMMTSLYPGQLGLVEKPAPRRKRFQWREERAQRAYTIPQSAYTLSEIFADHGFRTAAFVNQRVLDTSGFGQGFTDWFYPASEQEIRRHDPGSDSDREATTALPQWPDQARVDSNMVVAFESWMAECRERDIFVWLHLLSPHFPYEPPMRHTADRSPSALYDGEVRYVDELIGRVINAIDKSAGLDKSVIVFTSDHGEEFGEHGMEGHGHSLHREVTWVPLIITGPRVARGGTIDHYVSTLDVMPTILAMARMSPRGRDDMVGTSLLPLADGAGGDRICFAEGMLYGSTERSLIKGGYKIMYDGNRARPRLYQAVSDHMEATDLAREESQRAADMGAMLEAMHDSFESYHALRFGQLADSLASDEERERTLDAMRALGYIK